jgi:NADP-dependent 3-hydroxy acid dehydrogenase YdfG
VPNSARHLRSGAQRRSNDWPESDTASLGTRHGCVLRDGPRTGPPGRSGQLYLIVVVRQADRLAALAGELSAVGATTKPVVVDLAQAAGVQEVAEVVAGPPVDGLVNDASVGGRGSFASEPEQTTDLAMIQLDVTTLVELTVLLPGMLDVGSTVS